MALLFESWSTDLLVALVSLCIFIYWFFNNNWDYWEKRNVPFCKPSPFVGNFKDRVLFRKGLNEIAVDQYNELAGHKFGGIWLFQSPCLLIRDPEVIKRVLVKDFSSFHDRGVVIDEKINPLAEHLFTLSGSKWRALRIKLTPTFTSGKMKMMFSLMNECATELVQFLTSEAAKSAGELEVKEILAKFTTDVIGSCAFGLQFNSMKNPNSEFRAMGRKITSPNPLFALRFTFLQFAPKLAKRMKLRIFPSDVSAFFLNAVKETIEYREKNKVKRNDFLQLLIDLKNKGKVEEDQHEDTMITVDGISKENDDAETLKFTDNLLAAQAFVFFVAGFEATSTTISFALHELSVNREIQEKARKEIDNILQETNGEITYEALKRMDYIDNIISETLRKYPPAAVLLRTCTETYKEPETGLVIEEGTRVQIPVYALHHDPKYFPNPEGFDPERFSEGERAKRHNYVYMPFGEGPRTCIALTTNSLAAQVFVFFVAGFETTSTTMSFALHELSVNRDIQEKAQKEIDDVLEETNGEITYEGLKKMEYLDNIISETLRKYPPLAVLIRECNKAYKEPETGVLIEEGTRIQIPVYALHHDPRHYPAPERFDPDRFSEEAKAKRHHYVYLPFGEGPRICIGMRFGLLQTKLGLATLLSRFDVIRNSRTHHPIRLDPKTNFTASKDGIWVRLTSRNVCSTKL